MADKGIDFYAVLGLKKECTAADLRNAYKRLAMEWHPDRLSASGNSKYVEEAKRRFQAIQQAYSVLSDANKRFLYDVGVYDSNDDNDEHGMGDFLSEMATMMSQTKSNENRNETLEELFNEMLRSDIEASRSATHPMCSSSSQPSDDNSSGGEQPHFCTGKNHAHAHAGESSRRKNSRKGSYFHL